MGHWSNGLVIFGGKAPTVHPGDKWSPEFSVEVGIGETQLQEVLISAKTDGRGRTVGCDG